MPYSVTTWDDRRYVASQEYATEAAARTAARAWAGPKQDKPYAAFAELLALYTEKKPQGMGRKAPVDGPRTTALMAQHLLG